MNITMMISAAALIAAVSAFGGWKFAHDADMAATAKQAIRTITITKTQGAISTAAGIETQKTIDHIVYQTQTLTKEVPVYVTAKDDAACVVNNGFVRLWNGATGVSGLPDAPAESDDAPSGVPLSEVGRADVANYGASQANAAELAALQAWVIKQQAAFAGK